MKLYGGSGSSNKKTIEKDALLAETIKLTDISEILKEIPKEDTYNNQTQAAEVNKDEDMSRAAERKSAASVKQRGGAQAKASVKTKEEQEEIDALISNYQKYKKRKRIAIIAVILTVLVCGFFVFKTVVRPPDVSGSKNPNPPLMAGGKDNPGQSGTAGAKTKGGRKEGVYTFMLVGLDQLQANTDTMMVGRLDTVNRKLNIISIPRDTCANVRYSVKKINAVYALGGGIDALREALSEMTGFYIDSYVMVDIEAFTAVVDTLGGVYFDIPHYMDYDDPTQDLHIHFSAGYTQLSGAEAVKVMRWRQNNDGTNYGDIERIKTQQSFLMTVAKQCLSVNNLLTKVDDYARIFKEYVDTDLSVGNMAWYGKEFLKLTAEDITFDKIPANYFDSIKGFSYGTILVSDWVKMVNEQLNPYVEDITETDMNIITRDANGNLYATGGEISGGYESFLDYDEYMASLGYGHKAADSDGSADTPAITAPPEETLPTAETEDYVESTDPAAGEPSAVGTDSGEDSVGDDTDTSKDTGTDGAETDTGEGNGTAGEGTAAGTETGADTGTADGADEGSGISGETGTDAVTGATGGQTEETALPSGNG